MSSLRELRGENENVMHRLHEFAAQGFAKLIAVGRVEEIAAGLDIAIEDAPGLLGIGPMSPFGSELRHPQTGCWPSSLYRIACSDL